MLDWKSQKDVTGTWPHVQYVNHIQSDDFWVLGQLGTPVHFTRIWIDNDSNSWDCTRCSQVQYAHSGFYSLEICVSPFRIDKNKQWNFQGRIRAYNTCLGYISCDILMSEPQRSRLAVYDSVLPAFDSVLNLHMYCVGFFSSVFRISSLTHWLKIK